jgi:DNA-binding NarL/FixJ family response regulator
MILIVDDDPIFLEEAGKVLNRDRQVFLAINAQQGFMLAEKLGFSVVLVDLDLRGEDGFTLIERLHEAFPELAIIAISSVLKNNTREEAKAAGAIDVFAETCHSGVESSCGTIPITAEKLAISDR